MTDERRRSKVSFPAPIRWMGLVVRALVGPPARAVRGTARAVADPGRQVREYWRSERVTMRQSIIANCISSITALVAGLTLAGMDHRIEQVDGLFVLIPVSIGMRGNIFGALAARLGTSIHSGLFEVSRERSGLLYQNVYAAILLTFTTSVTMGLLGRAIASLLHIETVGVWDLILIAMVGGLLSSVVVLTVTVILSVVSFRRGWDLDSVGAPLITTTGDVITLPMLLVASFLIDIDLVPAIAGGLSLAAALFALVRGWRTDLQLTRRIVRESFAILCVAIVLDILAGTVVEPRMEKFLAFPALLLVIPGFLEKTGALGSILASRLGSKLHLGSMSARAKPEAAALLDGSVVLGIGFATYTLTAVSTLALAEVLGYRHPGALTFVGAVMLGGILATLVASVIGYYAAIATYRFGFDPDNHTIPVVTSGMDLLGIICFVVSLTIFQVV